MPGYPDEGCPKSRAASARDFFSSHLTIRHEARGAVPCSSQTLHQGGGGAIAQAQRVNAAIGLKGFDRVQTYREAGVQGPLVGSFSSPRISVKRLQTQKDPSPLRVSKGSKKVPSNHDLTKRKLTSNLGKGCNGYRPYFSTHETGQ